MTFGGFALKVAKVVGISVAVVLISYFAIGLIYIWLRESCIFERGLQHARSQVQESYCGNSVSAVSALILFIMVGGGGCLVWFVGRPLWRMLVEYWNAPVDTSKDDL